MSLRALAATAVSSRSVIKGHGKKNARPILIRVNASRHEEISLTNATVGAVVPAASGLTVKDIVEAMWSPVAELRAGAEEVIVMMISVVGTRLGGWHERRPLWVILRLSMTADIGPKVTA